MPNKIDTSGIPRIGIYTTVIESANLVPDTSQEILDKALSSMRIDIEDLNSQWLNLILSIGLMNGLAIIGAVFSGSIFLIIVIVFLTCLMLYLNSMREETVSLDLTAKVLTEEKSNVPPISATNSRIG